MERLNKFLAHAGVGSRRYCDELIAAGRVKVDGVVVRELGKQVEHNQTVCVDDVPVKAERLVYWVVNKPKDYLCTNYDPAGRPLAVDLVPYAGQRLYTVGRLDEASEGLLLLTNDGDLAYRLMHPRFGIEKTYLVQVAGWPSDEDLARLTSGIWLSDGRVQAKHVKRVKKQGASTWLRIVLAEGRNREIRRMLARAEHKVLSLKRIAIGPIKLKTLAVGKARRLTPQEVCQLRQVVAQEGVATSRRARPAASKKNSKHRSSRDSKHPKAGKRKRVREG
ncbi:MAG: hypothetical protein KatS3mg105_0191 [Gemmatales bacterium]|nr:MAG: hypothetical protein KatS3mg105_0191 [Gemmatales bacterium]